MLLSDDCLTSVCRTTFKDQGHQAAMLNAVLARQAAAALGMRTFWPWETADTLRLLGGARRGRRGRDMLCRHAHSLLEAK